MPRSNQPLTTVPIVHKSQVRISTEIILDNQSVGSVLMSGSLAVDNIKFESGKGVLEYILGSGNKPPNVQDITSINPQFSA